MGGLGRITTISVNVLGVDVFGHLRARCDRAPAGDTTRVIGDCGKLKNWKYTGVTECTGEEQKGVCELVGLDIVVVCGIE